MNDNNNNNNTVEFNQFNQACCDVLERIAEYLSVRDLCRISQVCTNFRNIALREKAKRGPETHIVVFDTHAYIWEEGILRFEEYTGSRLHISEYLRSVPKVCLFFCDNKPDDGFENVERALAYFARQLPNSYIISVGQWTISKDTEQIFTNTNTALGIFFPTTPMLQVNICSADIYILEKNTNLAETYAEILYPTNQSNSLCNTCIIMLTYDNWHSTRICVACAMFSQKFVSNLAKRYYPGTLSFWGCTVPTFHTTDPEAQNMCPTRWVAISLSGPGIKSWSIVLSCELNDSEIEEKLICFHKELKPLYSQTLGFMTAPSIVLDPDHENLELNIKYSKIIKKIFPTIPIFSIFNSNEEHQFGINSMSDEKSPNLRHMQSIIFMVLTYR